MNLIYFLWCLSAHNKSRRSFDRVWRSHGAIDLKTSPRVFQAPPTTGIIHMTSIQLRNHIRISKFQYLRCTKSIWLNCTDRTKNSPVWPPRDALNRGLWWWLVWLSWLFVWCDVMFVDAGLVWERSWRQTWRFLFLWGGESNIVINNIARNFVFG